MPYIMEVSRGSRGSWLSGSRRGATGAPLAAGSARALMILLGGLVILSGVDVHQLQVSSGGSCQAAGPLLARV
jgi:hypothetical protein